MTDNSTDRLPDAQLRSGADRGLAFARSRLLTAAFAAQGVIIP
jgi:hypothetical protein